MRPYGAAPSQRSAGLARAGLLAIGLSSSALWSMAVLLTVGAVSPVWAQSGGASGLGVVQAVSYREVPDPLSLSVILFDDSRLDLRIRDQMLAALERANHDLGDNPLFELELSSTTRSGRFVADGPSLGRLSTTSDESSRVEMNVWSSSQDSILGGRYADREGRTFSSFEIEAVLRERSLGEVVWEGHAIVETDRGQAEPYVPQMVESLVRSLGRTVREQTFSVY